MSVHIASNPVSSAMAARSMHTRAKGDGLSFGAMQDAVGFELPDPLRRVTQIIAQNFSIVLAERRRCHFAHLGKSRKSERKCRHVELAHQPVVQCLYRP